MTALPARNVFGYLVLALWAYVGLASAGSVWLSAVQTPQGSALSESSLTRLMSAAREECPGEPRPLLLSDEPVAWMQGSYLLYPRRIDVVQRVDGFTGVDLDGYRGGCLMWYRSQEERLEAFRGQLSVIVCTPEGCLYRIDARPPDSSRSLPLSAAKGSE